MSEPRERPIIMSDDMVLAIRDARKTEPRRVVNVSWAVECCDHPDRVYVPRAGDDV